MLCVLSPDFEFKVRVPKDFTFIRWRKPSLSLLYADGIAGTLCCSRILFWLFVEKFSLLRWPRVPLLANGGGPAGALSGIIIPRVDD